MSFGGAHAQDINVANNDGETPLLVAAQHGHKAGYHHCI